ncbi:MAG: hypothetical protein LDLANPLL_00978 [Turneriella sp.]|nr:hypothetical protein [Turneriella sp.]
MPCSSAFAFSAYLSPRLYGFDSNPADYKQKELSDTLQYLLSHPQFSVQQVGYPTVTGTFTNLQVITDFTRFAAIFRMELVSDSLNREIYNAERFIVFFYESLARRWENLNPIPGLYYTVIIRNPAYPYLFMESFDADARLLGTFPFMDDYKVRLTKVFEQQFAFGFRVLFG